MRARAVVAGVLLTLLAVAGCSGSSGSRSASGDLGAAPANGAAAAAPGAGKVNGDAAVGSSRGRVTTTALSTGAKIRTASMTVSVKKGAVPQQANAADAIATGAGGEVDADDRTTGSSPSAQLVLLVPPQALTATLTELSRLGHEDARSLSTRDVTTQVADVNSRVTSARAAIARLTSLYARGGKVSDIIAIESELAQRQSDLESLEAQQKALTEQTSFATITLTLRTLVAAKKHTSHARTGLVGGLVRGWHAFVHAAAAVATGVATALPFLILLVLAIYAARLLWTKRGHRPAPAPSSEPTP